jgi:hypothetical protein
MSQLSQRVAGKPKLSVVEQNDHLRRTEANKDRRKPPPPVYALRQWSIRKHGERFQIADTLLVSAGAVEWTGKYKTLQAATLGIARRLAEEFTERHARRCKFHGIDD